MATLPEDFVRSHEVHAVPSLEVGIWVIFGYFYGVAGKFPGLKLSVFCAAVEIFIVGHQSCIMVKELRE